MKSRAVNLAALLYLRLDDSLFAFLIDDFHKTSRVSCEELNTAVSIVGETKSGTVFCGREFNECASR